MHAQIVRERERGKRGGEAVMRTISQICCKLRRRTKKRTKRFASTKTTRGPKTCRQTDEVAELPALLNRHGSAFSGLVVLRFPAEDLRSLSLCVSVVAAWRRAVKWARRWTAAVCRVSLTGRGRRTTLPNRCHRLRHPCSRAAAHGICVSPVHVALLRTEPHTLRHQRCCHSR